MIASSSATTTRTALLTSFRSLDASGRQTRARELVGHAIEQCVLLALELGNRTTQFVALTSLRLGVALGLVRLRLGKRRLRDERTQARVISLVDEKRTLLVGDGELRAQSLQA